MPLLEHQDYIGISARAPEGVLVYTFGAEEDNLCFFEWTDLSHQPFISSLYR